jgi:hypothetical protein
MSGRIERQLDTLGRRSEVLRQINSDQMFRAESRERHWAVGLTVLTSALGFIGFTGVDRIRMQLAGVWAISEEAVTMLFNVVVLATIIAGFIVIYRRDSERASRHLRAIQDLASFKLDVDNILTLAGDDPGVVDEQTLAVFTARYHGIVASLPPSTDRDYLRSKASLRRKDLAKRLAASSGGDNSTRTGTTGAAAKGDDEPSLASVLWASPTSSSVLTVLAGIEPSLGVSLYACGGVIRNTVWDRHCGYIVGTPLDDVDVIFRSEPAEGPSEDAVVEALKAVAPNVNWSARDMRTIRPKFGRGRYGSIPAAVAEFPETASAVAVRVVSLAGEGNGTLEIVAPYGLEDLFGGLICPVSPRARRRVLHRLRKRRWLLVWPELQTRGIPRWRVRIAQEVAMASAWVQKWARRRVLARPGKEHK